MAATVPCTDGNALTGNSTTVFNCQANYTLFDNQCEYGFPYALFPGYGLSKPFAAKQQPFGPFTPDHQNTELCAITHPKARVIFFIGFSFNPATCSGQNVRSTKISPE
ncbi:hypothetical protein MVLG_05569 [Microbotryum lychnidis-dioicae p1A1 Lamole]|uniref:Uncharacterized protein n=1 Tax=Microbotryum lychnidis-dioicae (strain p1A1 Lamole / MvSl-1064) TaxID=683840 RepID=U5HEM6_USTV1|nr:hypothetical protein MVLG_05569 [Microbotryum lychnidis-dioicae p1A1 Lamole]|eukprot:KDE04000.1 hypothetical protein MVLG_05569 [Microbotryum lychnidis-dioicae p1A1 Lamole]